MANRLRKLLNNFVRFRPDKMPSGREGIPIVDKNEDVVTRIESSDSRISSLSQLDDFRILSSDREVQYNTYDEMATDSVIAAALELYADDATSYDEQGRIIWVESDDEEIAKAGNRLLDQFEIPERAWKHIYQACKYGDYYLKLYRKSDINDQQFTTTSSAVGSVRVVNDVIEDNGPVVLPYDHYVEDVYDPATVFDLRKRGKTVGFVEVKREYQRNTVYASANINNIFMLKDVNVYRPDRLIHIMISENLTRTPETITLDLGDEEYSTTYEVARGKSVLYDVYPIQRELQLLEDSLLLNRLTRSSLIRLLEIEVGDMPKSEVNDYLRRTKNLVEQHIAMDKTTGNYKSYNAPGPIDNIIYVPVRNGKGHIDINNLGGDVNIRDIADVDYFSNKRAGALKIPRQYLGDSNDGGIGIDTGGTLTQQSIRYARTIKRIQTSYIRAITTLLNLFFIDMKLDYVNKFTVRMTSPSTQEDLSRNDLLNGSIDLISSIMSLMESLEGDTQKKILEFLISRVLKMPEISTIISEDSTPEEEISIDGVMTPSSGGSRSTPPSPSSSSLGNITSVFGDSSSSPLDDIEGFTDAEYQSFTDL